MPEQQRRQEHKTGKKADSLQRLRKQTAANGGNQQLRLGRVGTVEERHQQRRIADDDPQEYDRKPDQEKLKRKPPPNWNGVIRNGL